MLQLKPEGVTKDNPITINTPSDDPLEIPFKDDNSFGAYSYKHGVYSADCNLT